MDAVLFDIGSTLVQGPELSPASMIIRLLGLPDSEKGRVADIIMCRVFEEPKQLCGCLKEAFPALNLQESMIKELLHDQEKAPREIEGATMAVRHIKEAGFKVGLVSDIWGPYYRGFVAVCPELASMVDYAGLSFREGVRKPATVLFEKAVRELQVNPKKTWMIGDTYENDLVPAMKMGMSTVWVLSRPEKEFRAMDGVLKGYLKRPDIIIDTVADVVGIDLRKG